jgi:MoaD family protein
MMVQVRFFAYFREIFGTAEERRVLPEGTTVGGLLDALCDTPRRRAEIFAGGSLQPAVIVMKNRVSIQSLQGPATPLADGDTIAVFPFVGGG